MNLSMTYTLIGKDGTVLIPPSVIALNRAMTYSDQYSQAKAAEVRHPVRGHGKRRDRPADAPSVAVVRSLHPAPGQAGAGRLRRARRCRRRRCERRAVSV